MRRTGLSAYRLVIRDRHARNAWRFALHSENDAFSELHRYLRARQGQLLRLGEAAPDGTFTDNRAIKLVRLEANQARRMLCGLFLKGEAGLIQEIHDLDRPAAVATYTTRRSEAPLLPLYFRFHVEDARSFGVALLQTFGKDGLKSYLQDDLDRFFERHVPPITVSLTQLLDRRVLEQFATAGRLQNVILINSGKTQASRTSMQRTTIGDDELGEPGDRLAYKIHRQSWPVRTLRNLLQAVTMQRDPRDIIHMPGLGAIDDMLVEIKLGSRTQRFSLLDPDDSPIRHDITENTALGTNGFPTWESVHAAADDIWAQLRPHLH